MLRYLILTIAGFLMVASMTLLVFFPIWWVVLLVLLLCLSILGLAHYYIYQNSSKKWSDLFLVVATILGFVGLLFLVEWSIFRYLLIVFGGLVIAFLFSRHPSLSEELPHLQKPIRRITMMIWVFDAFALATLMYALEIFFQNVPFIILAILGIAMFFYATIVIWQEYFDLPINKLLAWSAVLNLGILEIFWVFHYLSLGYFVLGILSAWLWYLGMLLVRFNLTVQGITWKKQRWFLMLNFSLMILFLIFVVKWI